MTKAKTHSGNANTPAAVFSCLKVAVDKQTNKQKDQQTNKQTNRQPNNQRTKLQSQSGGRQYPCRCLQMYSQSITDKDKT